MGNSSVMKVNKNDEVSSVAFFGVNEKQIRVQTNTPKSITIPNDKKELCIYDINKAIDEVLVKHGAKHYQFETIVTDGKDDNGKQLYKRKTMTKLTIPFEVKLNGHDGYEMFSCDSWKKHFKTISFIERY